MKTVFRQVIRYILCIGAGAGAATSFSEKKREKEKAELTALSNKHLTLFRMMADWVKLLQQGKSVKDYIDSNGYKKVAIYGMSYVGDCLVSELKTMNLDLLYGIDTAGNSVWADIPIVGLNDELDDVDVVIVTPITAFDNIKEKLSGYFDCPIVSMEEVLYEVRRM